MKKGAKNSGFSIIEVIFAMLFMTVILFGVIQLQSGNLAMINRQNNEIQAHLFANQGLEILKAIPGEPSANGEFIITKTGDNYSVEGIGGDAWGEPIPGTDFFRKIVIDDTGVAPAWLSESIITWEDGTGEHSVSAKRVILP